MSTVLSRGTYRDHIVLHPSVPPSVCVCSHTLVVVTLFYQSYHTLHMCSLNTLVIAGHLSVCMCIIVLSNLCLKISQTRGHQHHRTWYKLCDLLFPGRVGMYLSDCRQTLSKLSKDQSQTRGHQPHPHTYCKCGYFRWGKISRKCWQDLLRGGYFHNTTPMSFIKAFGLYICVGVIFVKKTKTRKTRKLPPRENFHVYSIIRCVTYISCRYALISHLPTDIFMPPDWMIGAYYFCPVFLFVCVSFVNFNLHYNFWTVRDRDFMFGMHTQLMRPFQITPRSTTLWPWLWPWSWK